jgi:hypothetical protein
VYGCQAARGQGDGVAEGFGLADVAAFLGVRVGAAAEVIGAEVTEPGVGILQQVSDEGVRR